MFDLLIKNGTVVDGTGGPGFPADVAVLGDEIAALGATDAEAREPVDASGLTVTPGFIDLHSHSDGSFLIDSKADSKLRQGVTLELMGNCGMSVCAPLHVTPWPSGSSATTRIWTPTGPTWAAISMRSKTPARP